MMGLVLEKNVYILIKGLLLVLLLVPKLCFMPGFKKRMCCSHPIEKQLLQMGFPVPTSRKHNTHTAQTQAHKQQPLKNFNDQAETSKCTSQSKKS